MDHLDATDRIMKASRGQLVFAGSVLSQIRLVKGTNLSYIEQSFCEHQYNK